MINSQQATELTKQAQKSEEEETSRICEPILEYIEDQIKAFANSGYSTVFISLDKGCYSKNVTLTLHNSIYGVYIQQALSKLGFTSDITQTSLEISWNTTNTR